MVSIALLALFATLAAAAAQKPRPRIVNGVAAQPFVYSKWLGAFFVNGRLTCGAFLAGPNTVVTAAHCIDANRSPTVYTVQALRHDLKSATEQGVVMRGVKSIVHPRYNATTLSYDVAVLQVDSSYATAWPALDDGAFSVEKSGDPNIFTIAGWGTVSQGGPLSPVLLEARVPQENQTVCASKFADLDSSMLCAGGGLQDSCNGDSGGPMFVVRDGVTTIVGITSNGVDCATPGYPGVYTRISQVWQFILDAIALFKPASSTTKSVAISTSSTRRMTSTSSTRTLVTKTSSSAPKRQTSTSTTSTRRSSSSIKSSPLSTTRRPSSSVKTTAYPHASRTGLLSRSSSSSARSTSTNRLW